jgi:hypothetical protein
LTASAISLDPWIGFGTRSRRNALGIERKIDTTHKQELREPEPVWTNTRPRGNPEPDHRDLERSIERLEALLGR